MTSRKSNTPRPSEGPPLRQVPAFPARFPAQLHDDLRLYAALSGKSMNDVVNRAVQKFLAEPGTAVMLDHARKIRAEGGDS